MKAQVLVKVAVVLAASTIVMAGCGGDSDKSGQPDKAELLKVIAENGSTEADPECVAEMMLADGVTQGQVDEMVKWDGSGSTPAGVEMYRVGRDACGGSAQATMDSIAAEIEGN